MLLLAAAPTVLANSYGRYHQKYYKKNPLRYNFYRYRCDRDARIMELWGKDAHRGIVKQ